APPIARRGVKKIPAATYSPTRKPCSTIGSGGLNCRVRDGNGWSPSDVATGKLGRLHRKWSASSWSDRRPMEPPQNDAYAQALLMRVVRAVVPRSTLVFVESVKQLEEKNDQAARAISIGQLNALPRLHLRPINVVVFDGSSGDCSREA